MNEIDSPPTQIDISSVTYDLSEMVVTWGQSNDNDFVSYELLQSDSENGTYSSVIVITDQTTTSHSLIEYDPTHENWFKVKVTDFWNLTSTGNGMTNEIESTPPIPSVLYPITYNDGFQISWSQNNDDDFKSYILYESLSEDMSNDTLIYETDDRTDTTYFKTIQNFRYYQITSEDVWGLQSTSNIEVGDYDVELWGEYYSVLNTTSLNLLNRELTGSIPSEIGNLTNLTYLGLNNNELSGSIPPEIGNIIGLTHLYLFDNQLTGEIPPEIGNLTNLEYLILYNNQLTGEIPPEIGNLTNLEYLILYNNQLTGSIPSGIGNLTNLTTLNLGYNQLTGEIPSEIGNLTNLTYLSLKENNLTGSIPPEIGNLTNLVLLNLSQNQLTGEIPESICDLNIDLDGICWGLNCFNISNNQLCPPYPSCIENWVGEQDTSNCD